MDDRIELLVNQAVRRLVWDSEDIGTAIRRILIASYRRQCSSQKCEVYFDRRDFKAGERINIGARGKGDFLLGVYVPWGMSATELEMNIGGLGGVQFVRNYDLVPGVFVPLFESPQGDANIFPLVSASLLHVQGMNFSATTSTTVWFLFGVFDDATRKTLLTVSRQQYVPMRDGSLIVIDSGIVLGIDSHYQVRQKNVISTGLPVRAVFKELLSSREARTVVASQLQMYHRELMERTWHPHRFVPWTWDHCDAEDMPEIYQAQLAKSRRAPDAREGWLWLDTGIGWHPALPSFSDLYTRPVEQWTGLPVTPASCAIGAYILWVCLEGTGMFFGVKVGKGTALLIPADRYMDEADSVRHPNDVEAFHLPVRWS